MTYVILLGQLLRLKKKQPFFKLVRTLALNEVYEKNQNPTSMTRANILK